MDSVAAVSDIFGLAEDSVAAVLDIVELESAGLVVLPAVGDVPPEESIVSIFRSLAQPPTMSPKHVIKMAFLSMSIPPVKCLPNPPLEKMGRYSLYAFVSTQ